MIQFSTADLEMQIARRAWRERAAREGIYCFDCLDVPALEHRQAYYDTGLCERCAAAPEAAAA